MHITVFARVAFCSVAVVFLIIYAVASRAETAHSEADAKRLVASAIATYQKQGRSAFKSISDPKGPYAEGSLYVFVIEYEGKTVAHAGFPDLVGDDANRTLDSSGQAVYPLIVSKVTEQGAWVSYQYTNPLTNREESKRSWVVLFDDLIFGAGLYSR